MTFVRNERVSFQRVLNVRNKTTHLGWSFHQTKTAS